jgi:hypothetical protein
MQLLTAVTSVYETTNKTIKIACEAFSMHLTSLIFSEIGRPIPLESKAMDMRWEKEVV